MKFCMITTFFGAHRFGGDAVYVDRLCRALLRAGHEVHVVHCADAFETVRRGDPLKVYVPPDDLHIHTIESPIKILPSLWNHQTGTMGIKGKKISEVLANHDFDVIHYHNISLIGGPKVLEAKTKNSHVVKLLSTHEFWLLCPLSLLWKFDEKICDAPECFKCSLKACRPPQLWRKTDMLKRSLEHLDAILFPSSHTLEMHKQYGIRHGRMIHLPLFLPKDWFRDESDAPLALNKSGKPYFVMAGRLVREKGYQDVIKVMPRFPTFDLKIAGSGPFFQQLRRKARGMKNVHFLGQLSFYELERVFRSARALIVPSLFFEIFGYVVLEAFSTRTPVIAADRGSVAEILRETDAGFTYGNREQLVSAMKTLARDEQLAEGLGKIGEQSVAMLWSEDKILRKYLSIVWKLREQKER